MTPRWAALIASTAEGASQRISLVSRSPAVRGKSCFQWRKSENGRKYSGAARQIFYRSCFSPACFFFKGTHMGVKWSVKRKKSEENLKFDFLRIVNSEL